jgi:hypothetical protein
VFSCILLAHQADICWPIKPAVALIPQERDDQMNQPPPALAYLSRWMEKIEDGWMEELEVTASRPCKKTMSGMSCSAQIRWHDLGTSGHGELKLSSGQLLSNPSLRLFPFLPRCWWNPSLQSAPPLSCEVAYLLSAASAPVFHRIGGLHNRFSPSTRSECLPRA